MSFLKKHLNKLRDGRDSPTDGPSSLKKIEQQLNGAISEDTSPGGSGANTPDSRRRSREQIREERVRRSLDKERSKAEAKKRQSLARMEEERFLEEGPENMTRLYKPFSMNMSKHRDNQARVLFKELDFPGTFPPEFLPFLLPSHHPFPLRQNLGVSHLGVSVVVGDDITDITPIMH